MKSDWLKEIGIAMFLTFLGVLLGGGIVVSPNGIITFIILSLLVPLVLHYLLKRKGMEQFPWHNGIYCYVWFFWINCLIIGGPTIPEFLLLANPFFIGIISHLILLITLALMYGSSTLLVKIWKRPGTCWHMDLLKVSLLSLPLPIFWLGSVFFRELSADMFLLHNGQSPIQTIFIWSQFSLWALAISVIATITFYFYPWHRERKLRFVPGITLRVLSWVGLHVLGNYLLIELNLWPFVGNHLFPLFENNYLVYITPLVVEIVTLMIALWFGKMSDDFLVGKDA